MDFTNRYLQLLQNSKGNSAVTCKDIAQLTYLCEFQTNKKQLEIFLRNSSLNPIIKSQIINMNLEQKKRLDIITKSKLFTILTKRLLTY
jgi:hypothetical protein